MSLPAFTKIGMWAAHNLGAKSAAEIIFTDRLIACGVRKIGKEEGSPGQPPLLVCEYEHVVLRRTSDPDVMVGYSEKCNQLFVGLRSNRERHQAR